MQTRLFLQVKEVTNKDSGSQAVNIHVIVEFSKDGGVVRQPLSYGNFNITLEKENPLKGMFSPGQEITL